MLPLDFDPYTLIPPPVTARDVEIPQTPLPPMLPPLLAAGADEIGAEAGGATKGVTRDHILFLIRAYRACIAHRGLKTLAYSDPARIPADITRIKDYERLAGAVIALLEHEIAPHPWCSFQFNAFNHARVAAGEPPRVPSLAYVYDPETIAKRRGWYRSERDQHCLTRAAVPEALQQLRATYAEMEDVISRTPVGERSRDFYVGLRNRYFPGRAYSTAIAQARLQAALARQTMQEALSRGDWIWD